VDDDGGVDGTEGGRSAIPRGGGWSAAQLQPQTVINPEVNSKGGGKEGRAANQLQLSVLNLVLVAKGGGVDDSTFVDPVRILKDNFKRAIYALLANNL